jgi:hypothetical protein
MGEYVRSFTTLNTVINETGVTSRLFSITSGQIKGFICVLCRVGDTSIQKKRYCSDWKPPIVSRLILSGSYSSSNYVLLWSLHVCYLVGSLGPVSYWVLDRNLSPVQCIGLHQQIIVQRREMWQLILDTRIHPLLRLLMERVSCSHS